MLFYISFGCGCGTNELIVEAKSFNAAQDYAYDAAIEDYDSFAGLHGIPSLEDVCEDEGIEDTNSREAEEAYREQREMWIDYFVAPFDENNIDHQSCLEENEIYNI